VEAVDLGVEEHSDRQLDALHVAVGRLRLDLVLPRLHVVDYGLLDERDFEVEALAVDLR
jgi:hypothetical protein